MSITAATIAALVVGLAVGALFGFWAGITRGAMLGMLVRDNKTPSIGKWLLCVYGAVTCLVIAAGCAVYSVLFIAQSTPVTAKVINVIEKTDRDGDVRHYPVYEYFLPDGSRFEDRTSMGDGRNYAIGDEIPVRYLRKSPAESRIDYFTHSWGISVFMVVAATLLTCLAVILRRGERQRKTTQSIQ